MNNVNIIVCSFVLHGTMLDNMANWDEVGGWMRKVWCGGGMVWGREEGGGEWAQPPEGFQIAFPVASCLWFFSFQRCPSIFEAREVAVFSESGSRVESLMISTMSRVLHLVDVQSIVKR